jgi:hypothetical protein
MWQSLILGFFTDVFGANGVPHVVKGIIILCVGEFAGPEPGSDLIADSKSSAEIRRMAQRKIGYRPIALAVAHLHCRHEQTTRNYHRGKEGRIVRPDISIIFDEMRWNYELRPISGEVVGFQEGPLFEVELGRIGCRS